MIWEGSLLLVIPVAQIRFLLTGQNQVILLFQKDLHQL
jgi:hypothetical protein